MQGLASIDARLRTLEDESAIRDVISAYCYHADSGHDEDLITLFADEGVLSSKVAGAYKAAVGTSEIRAQVADPLGHHRPDLYRHGMHLLGQNLVIRVDGDTAIASSYSLLLLKRKDALEVYSASSNKWVLRRARTGWKILERSRRPLADEDFDEVLVALEGEVPVEDGPDGGAAH